MPDSVVSDIAQRLDLPPEQGDRVVRALARLIKTQSSREGRVRVPGLGVFTQSGEDLTFEADPALTTAINADYRGLSPVTLGALASEEEPAEPSANEAVTTEAVQEPPPVPVPEEQDPWARPPRAPEADLQDDPAGSPFDQLKPLPDEEEAQPESPDEAVWLPSDRKAAPSDAPEAEGDEVEHEAEPQAVEESPAEPPKAPTPVATAAADGTGMQDRPATAPSPRTQRSASAEEAESDRSIWPWLLVLLLLLIPAAGVYYYYEFLRQPEPSPVAQGPAESTPSDAAPSEAPAASEDAPADATEDPSPSEAPPEAPATETPPADETASLRIVPEEGGYTLYAASLPSREEAEAVAERYREELSGQLVPVGVVEASTDAGTRYRVAVGQTPTLDDVLALKERLGSTLPADAWARRIEDN